MDRRQRVAVAGAVASLRRSASTAGNAGQQALQRRSAGDSIAGPAACDARPASRRRRAGTRRPGSAAAPRGARRSRAAARGRAPASGRRSRRSSTRRRRGRPGSTSDVRWPMSRCVQDCSSWTVTDDRRQLDGFVLAAPARRRDARRPSSPRTAAASAGRCRGTPASAASMSTRHRRIGRSVSGRRIALAATARRRSASRCRTGRRASIPCRR